MSNTNREETKMTINELAQQLNSSSSEWLDAWTKATGPLATESDLVRFMDMAGQKRDMAQALVKMLAEMQLAAIQR